MPKRPPFDGLNTLHAQRVELLAKLARMDERIERWERLPPEPPIGSVVTFGKRMDNGETYLFAAIRGTHGKWSTTGPTCPWDGYTWNGLLRFAGTVYGLSEMPTVEYSFPDATPPAFPAVQDSIEVLEYSSPT